jgi:hypothetical protein
VYELFQALVGAVLPDYDDYYDASLLNSVTSHTGTLPQKNAYSKFSAPAA